MPPGWTNLVQPLWRNVLQSTCAFCACRIPSLLGFEWSLPAGRGHRRPHKGRSQRRKIRRRAEKPPRFPEWESKDAGPPKRGRLPLRGGVKHQLSATLYAQYAFRHRNADWHSFNVPTWYAKEYGVSQADLRCPVSALSAFAREKTLLARMSWMLTSGHSRPQNGGPLSQCLYRPETRPYKSRRGVWCALRTISRRLMQSDLVVQPFIRVTHYLPQNNAVRPAFRRQAIVRSDDLEFANWQLPHIDDAPWV